MVLVLIAAAVVSALLGEFTEAFTACGADVAISTHPFVDNAAERLALCRRLADGVFCTEYEDGTKVYVNYSYTDAYTADDGTLVKTRDYTVVR